MKRNWSKKELDEHFTLLPSENHLVLSKKTDANRLGFAVLLKYFQQEAQFPSQKQDVPKVVVQHLAVHTPEGIKVKNKSLYRLL